MDVTPHEDPLVDLYDPMVIRAIDRDPHAEQAHQVESLRGSRRAITGAALFTASVTGAAEALDLEPDEIIEEIEDFVVTGGPDEPVTLFFVPNNPYLTKAIVRPWLFDSGATS